ncbi:MAG TPA: plastocyanin/azurin family copper-binding protein [Actinomycetota bacterium]|jgi:plastocyanin|nr:plastocyanin/azurin family copper-binding protein [Actinomycetota bacterium]
MSMTKAVRAVLAAAAVFAFLPGVPAQAGGFCQEGKVTEGSGTTVTMGKNCFTPTVLRTDIGSEVTWVNKDPEAHTVTGAGGGWGSGHKEAAPSTTMTFRFKEPGVYSYTCLLHPGMTGTVVVGNGTGKGAAVEEISVEPVSATAARPAAKAARSQPSSEENTGAWAGIAIGAAVLGGSAGYGLGRRRRQVIAASS